MYCKYILCFLLFNFLFVACPAQTTKLSFLSTKFNRVSVKSAPSHNSVVKWVFIYKNEPLKIIAEFDNWRKIVDITNESGWVHITCLSDKQFVIICKKEKLLYKNPENNSIILARLKPGVRCKIEKSLTEWSKISIKGYKGWITNCDLWGS